MHIEIVEQKSQLRRRIGARLAEMTGSARCEASAKACALLAAQIRWQRAIAVLLYAPFGNELDIWPLVGLGLRLGKRVSLPRYGKDMGLYGACEIKDSNADLEAGRYGIREPRGHCGEIPLNQLDLILVPGVAFDLHGRRLGRGKGFFDRLLTEVRGTKCGIAFDEQIMDDIPVEPHDSDVNCILTPTRWIEL